MRQGQVEHYRSLLQREASEVRERLEHMEEGEELGSLKDSIQELSTVDNHPADIGTETFERSKDIALRNLAEEQLNNVNQALERIEQGNYGKCIKCGGEIIHERLEVVPAAVFCLECQEKAEAELDLHRSTTTPEPGFSKQDFEERVILDDVDAWQAVASYGTSSELVDGDYDGNSGQVGEKDEVTGDVDAVAYWRGSDGVFYQDFRGRDDESPPGGPV